MPSEPKAEPEAKPDPSNPNAEPEPEPAPAPCPGQVYMLAYCCYKRSTPVLYPRVILPGFLSGLMWAAAQTAWFVANASLSVAVAFPLITSGPGIVSSLWGVFVFKEITGRRNFVVLGAAIALALTGCVLIGVAKAVP